MTRRGACRRVRGSDESALPFTASLLSPLLSFFSDDSARLQVGSLSADEHLCALTRLCAEKKRRASIGAEEADSVIIVPMVNRWFPPPPRLYRKPECMTGPGAERSEIFHESLLDTHVCHCSVGT